MATSSSVESISVPKDFNFSSSLESGSRSYSSRIKCCLCHKLKSKFYCAWCINGGSIVNCSSEIAESLSEKRVKLNELKVSCNICEEKCNTLLKDKLKADSLAAQIRQNKERIALLKNTIKGRKKIKVQRGIELKLLIEANINRNAKIPEWQKSMERKLNVQAATKNHNEEMKKKLQKTLVKLKEIVRRRIKELELIFPISVIQPKSSNNQSTDFVNELAEARNTAFIENNWVYGDRSGELHHCIVAPLLPASGDYSPYREYIAAQNSDDVPSSSNSTDVKDNAAYMISAALTYLVQYVIMISYYLDVRFPHKMSISEFSTTPKSVAQFDRRISRLNRNILYLCLSQNTDITKLSPHATVNNLLQLLNVELTDLGRLGPMEISSPVTTAIEEAFKDDEIINEDSDSEDSDALTAEWEAVYVPTTDMEIPSSVMTTSQSNSIAGSLVSSAAVGLASFFRGWTTGR